MPTKPRRLLVPPIALALSCLLMMLLHYVAPVRTILTPPKTMIFGGLMLLLGGVIGTSGFRLFRKHDTGIIPFSPATALVTGGPYRFTRNPMYLGMVVMLIGVALWLGDATPPLVIPLFIAWITLRFIIPEEQFLTETFGQPYVEYRQRVRRWL